ncbi:LLM class flavin-dependent oxidoreductase [Pseudohaliea sp.]|uniref:LLM class flavin-dependent oxidoreductase n=1 Tax=Pseudohaliea sp. TaxID=2740289 RepID=UPI0032EBA86E
MDFGIAFPSYINAWRDAQIAEANGFSHAWFYDSQLLYSDVYATMALVAEHTRTIKLGTLVAVPTNRIAPVTASAVATINALAPGRVILGIGAGGTARNSMGLHQVKVKDLSSYVQQVRGLLAGEDVLFREGDAERWIRLLHRDRARGYINLDDPIEVHVAANGPRALRIAAEHGDGWITVVQQPKAIQGCLETIAEARGDEEPPYSTLLQSGACVLRDGESLTSPRVVQRLGPAVLARAHAAWETLRGGAGLGLRDDELGERYGEYVDAYAEGIGSPADRRYLDVHEGHLVYMKPGEEAFVDERGIARTFVGSPEQLLERIHRLEEAGVRHIAIQVVGTDGRELIEEFGKKILAKVN